MVKVAGVIAFQQSAMQRIRKYWLLITTYFEPSLGVGTSEVAPAKVISKVAPAKVISKVAPAAEQDEYGEFYFRHTILDQLGRYFVILKRMKRGDKDAYDLYSQLGAYILPERKVEGYECDVLEPRWLELRPSFGMVLHGSRSQQVKIDKEKRFYVPFAVYFNKYRSDRAPTTVQPVNSGDVYCCTVYWDTFHGSKKNGMKRGAPTEFALNVSPSGEVHILKVLENKNITIRGKKGKGRGSTFTVPQRRWGVPEFFEGWAKEHGEDVRPFLASIFIETANAQIAASSSMIKVKAYKGRLAAVFSVNILRTPYFFKDRDLYVNDRGKKKKIFHIVKTHIRKTGSVVRTHFRGMREFNWKGYRIRITVPGWHHVNTHDLNIGSTDEEHVEDIQDYIDTAVLGKTLSGLEEDSVGGFRR
jgi:hypothetical protein